MKASDHVRLMASYNGWMNARLYDAAGRLPADALALDREAYFGSVLGTLNHIVVADTIWLKRFATHPANYVELDPVGSLATPGALDEMLFEDFAAIADHRRRLDDVIAKWSETVSDTDLEHVLRYANMKGVVSKHRFFSLVMHFFNHQTHHRGQATTLLSQAGIDVGITDLLAVIPDERAG